MRIFIVAMAICGMFATAVQAADGVPPIVQQLPDTAANFHVYLFTLKQNKISLSMTAQEFCTRMDYGEAVLGDRPDEIGKDSKASPGKLEWVICKFKGK
jgi:hypothetical protein